MLEIQIKLVDRFFVHKFHIKNDMKALMEVSFIFSSKIQFNDTRLKKGSLAISNYSNYSFKNNVFVIELIKFNIESRSVED